MFFNVQWPFGMLWLLGTLAEHIFAYLLPAPFLTPLSSEPLSNIYFPLKGLEVRTYHGPKLAQAAH